MLKSIFTRRIGTGDSFLSSKKSNCVMKLMQEVLNTFSRRFTGKEIDRMVAGGRSMVLEIE